MKPTILVVDDSEVIRSVVQSTLEGAGYRVVTHGRATGCVSLILHERPDLVLLDVNMPGLRGDAVAKTFERTAQVAGTLVVLHSTLEEEELERLAAESGAQGYIQKTENPFSLLRQVARFLTKHTQPASGVMRALPPISESPASSQSTIRLGTTLLVDRNMAALSALGQLVQAAGFGTDFALSVAQARTKLVERSPTYVVAHADLPDGGAEQLFDAAVQHDSSYRTRFLLVVDGPGLRAPGWFAGPILRAPVQASDVQKALTELDAARTRTG